MGNKEKQTGVTGFIGQGFNERKSRTSIALTLAAGAIALPIATINFEPVQDDGKSFDFHTGLHRQGLPLIQEAAEQGHAEAQLLLSTIYRQGLGVEADEYLSFSWCLKAAEQGLPEAQFQLGLMYLEGEGVTDDEAEGFRWLWMAADQGHADAAAVVRYQLSDEYADEYGC